MIKIGRTKTASTKLLAYPAYGYPSVGDVWQVHVSGIAWQEPVVFSMRQKMMIRMLGGVMKATPEDLQCSTFQDRITPFMAEADQRQAIMVEISGQTYSLKRKTRRNGHFQGVLNIPAKLIEAAEQFDDHGNRRVAFSVFGAVSDMPPFCGWIYLHDRNGFSVISDIDDTIKDSAVGDRKELLTNTFLRDFRTITGMADVYQQWFQQGARFHYVSSSPWQLFESLHEMNHKEHFPSGTMHLRNFRLRDQLLKNVILKRHGKTATIRKLIKRLSERRFILVGDSGEKDPEIYGKICRQFPHRVKAVFIRELDDCPLEGERERKLRAAVGHGVYGKFHDADELAKLSNQLF